MGQPLRPDVLVVGGGPIGLAAAIAARLHGLRAALLDPRRPPIDRACGEGIMPGGMELLQKLGVEIPAGEGVPLAGIEFIEGNVRVRARFRHGPGRGLRRTALHAALARRAAELGVDLRWGVEACALGGGGIEVDGERVAARWVVGADGLNSPVRRAAGLDVDPVHRRFGIRRHYAIAPWTDLVEVHWSRHGEAYVTPVGPANVGVAILSGGTTATGCDEAPGGDAPAEGDRAGDADQSARFDRALAHFPRLERCLGGSRPVTETLGSGTVFRRLPRVVRGATALVGDASGSVDAISGDGLTLGLRQAVLLARCLKSGDLGGYDRAHRRVMRRANGMTALLLAAHAHPRLRRPILGVLSLIPPLFALLLSLHTRALPIGGSDRAWRPAGGR